MLTETAKTHWAALTTSPILCHGKMKLPCTVRKIDYWRYRYSRIGGTTLTTYEDRIVRTKSCYKWHEWAVIKRKRDRRDNETRFLNSHQWIKNRRILYQMAYYGGVVSALYTRYELIQKVKLHAKWIGERIGGWDTNKSRQRFISQLQDELNRKEEEMMFVFRR